MHNDEFYKIRIHQNTLSNVKKCFLEPYPYLSNILRHMSTTAQRVNNREVAALAEAINQVPRLTRAHTSCARRARAATRVANV